MSRKIGTKRLKSVLPLAKRFAKAVGGSSPKHIGEHRWSNSNDSATVVTRSPEESVRVVCVVSIFADGSTTLSIFSDEDLSETNRFENIGHFSYKKQSVSEMKKDLKWVWETVDRYRRSWQDDSSEEDY